MVLDDYTFFKQLCVANRKQLIKCCPHLDQTYGRYMIKYWSICTNSHLVVLENFAAFPFAIH